MDKKSLQKQIFLGIIYLTAILLLVLLITGSNEAIPLESIAFVIVLILLNYFRINLPFYDFKIAFAIIIAGLLAFDVTTAVILSFFAFFDIKDFKEKISLYNLFCKLSIYLTSIQAAGFIFLKFKAVQGFNINSPLYLFSGLLVASFVYFLIFNVLDFLRIFFFNDIKIEEYFSFDNLKTILFKYIMLIAVSLLIYLTYVWSNYPGILVLFIPYYFWREIYYKNLELEENFIFNQRHLINEVEKRALSFEDHSFKVAKISRKIGQRIDMSKNDLEILEQSALLHDIGMLGDIRKYVSKPERLTYEEYKIIQNHPQIVASAFRKYKLFKKFQKAVLYHHEHFDGTGYPQGLIGESIPLISRIVGVADAFNSLTSPRSFREKKTYEEAKEEIKKFSGTQFDPDIVDIIVYLIEEEEL
ncbi:MAG: HD domain-containing protein [Actinomycetia bacterium]|nr:HD domain-containing protein [Actinomycetes bacterium]